MEKPLLIWFRHDLRCADNPALYAASLTKKPLLAVYIYDPEGEKAWEYGGATKWWLHHSLKSLKASLAEKGIPLVIRRGDTLKTLKVLFQETGAEELYFNHRYEPYACDHAVLKQFPAYGFHGSLLFEPGSILNKQGGPFQVFTPFYNTCLKQQIAHPFPSPLHLKGYTKHLSSDELTLLPRIRWDKGFVWEVGEQNGLKKAAHFIKKRADAYAQDRDIPSIPGTSLLSPHLHFGEVGPRQLWKSAQGKTAFLRQLIWREFANHLLFFFPHTPTRALKEEFNAFPWKKNNTLLNAWKRGETGFPLIDAGMRQLWQTGWMHNRVRMLVASFLVKDLNISWVEGARFFWDTLVDADLANNTLGWQWVAGCGADAAPYFRIFNPVLQGEKFDPEGEYVKKYVPELGKLSAKWIHNPFLAPPEELEKAGIVLGKNYPFPIVNHEEAREESLKLYHRLKK